MMGSLRLLKRVLVIMFLNRNVRFVLFCFLRCAVVSLSCTCLNTIGLKLIGLSPLPGCFSEWKLLGENDSLQSFNGCRLCGLVNLQSCRYHSPLLEKTSMNDCMLGFCLCTFLGFLLL